MEANLFNSLPSASIHPTFPSTHKRKVQRLALFHLSRPIMVPADDVICLQAEGNYTFIYTRDQKRYLMSKTLKEFEKQLDDSLFIRTHKSHIINLGYVGAGIDYKDRYIQLVDGRQIPISRRRMKEIIDLLYQYKQLS